MKTMLFIAGLFLNVNVYAFTQNATLDFTNLYNNTNAGKYEMSVTFASKATPSVSTLKFSTHRDDNDLYCVTEAQFEIGQMTFSLTDVKTGWSFNVSKAVLATVSHQSDDETCVTDANFFAGEKTLWAQVGLNQAIELPVAAPVGYDRVAAYLSPFNGYLNLAAYLNVVNGQLVVNPSELLTAKSITSQNTQNASVTYYVFASKENTSLSLGTGLIKF
ncbi:hypothetical protein [Pseudobdellovibrio sp. HCB154]|uniref:hypothetical protein n=1 Tax=Pseudobdellovibrio sp. HCB154 TaxID=3386277 RepID=UPI00391733F8